MKKLLSLLLSIILIFSCVGVVSAREQEPEKKTYIVVLEAPAVYSPDRVTFYSTDDDMYRQALIELQAEVRAQINGGASTYSLRNTERTYTYTDVINGFTVNVDAATADEIKKIDGVKGVYENKTLNIIKPAETVENEVAVSDAAPQGESQQTSSANSGNMISTSSAYEKGYTGEGRAIAIIDSTINPDHIYYKLSDEATAKYTKTDIKNILDNNTMNVSATADDAYKNTKIPFAYNYPSDTATVTGSNLHGAHVAGVAAGNSVSVSDGVISGIAREAQILFFSVYRSGGTQTADIIAALEDAVKFDVDAINLSMGADFASEYMGEGPYNDAVIACRNAGKTVVFAAGNAGRASYSASFSDYGTSDNQNYLYSSKVGSIQAEYAYMNYLEDNAGNNYPCVAKGSQATLLPLEIVDCGTGTETEIKAVNVSGKIALIKMPDILVSESISTYGTRAMNHGAAAVVVAYYANDLPDGSSGYGYPLFLVAKDSAQKIKDSAQTLKYANTKAIIQRENAPRENFYSSYGYADNLDISVDFSAPGGNIYSSYSGTTGFANLSGTSMAAPQVTGATSLMYQYAEDNFPSYTGAAKVMLVKNLLASTAETVYTANGALSSPRKVGSGLIKLDKAMETAVILKGKNSDETKINLGANLSKSFDVTFTASNLGTSDVTFGQVMVELSTDDYKYYSGTGYGYNDTRALPATVSGASSVTVPAGASVDVTVSITLSDADITYLNTAMTNGFFIDGKVTLTGSDNCDVGIPFSGFYGNWSKLPIMNEKRVLDYFSLMGFSEDGFMPPAQILKENAQIVMPIANEVDESVAQIPVAVFANPIRNTFMTIKVDGTTVLDDAFINKFYDLGYYLENIELGDLSKASAITIELRLPYDTQGTSKQTFTITTVKDTSSPVISDVYASQKTDGDYAYLTVSDDYGVGAVTAMGEYNGEWYYSDVYIKNTSATAEFDITDLDNLHYYVYDCAFNMTALTPHIGINVNDGVATYTNTTHRNLSGVCLIAVYGDGNKMTYFGRLSDDDITIDAYDTAEFDVSAYEGKNYKLFFWSDLQSVTPICDAFETR